ncbi:MAG: hypothetical protein IMW89_07485 [Ktedonobacteraceae bacterium]|nr:hypothetical protein [Ktedonobacteraceae bacterium]
MQTTDDHPPLLTIRNDVFRTAYRVSLALQLQTLRNATPASTLMPADEFLALINACASDGLLQRQCRSAVQVRLGAAFGALHARLLACPGDAPIPGSGRIPLALDTTCELHQVLERGFRAGRYCFLRERTPEEQVATPDDEEMVQDLFALWEEEPACFEHEPEALSSVVGGWLGTVDGHAYLKHLWREKDEQLLC